MYVGVYYVHRGVLCTYGCIMYIGVYNLHRGVLCT